MNRHTSLAIVGTLLLVPSPSLTQGVPGTNLIVHVRVTAISISRDVTRITYVLKNDPQSQERLSTFLVDIPGPHAGVKSIARPSPQGSWMTHEKFGERSVAGWSVLGNHMRPPVPSAETVPDTLPPADVAMVPDSTVGVESDAVFQSPELLLIRARRLTAQACSPSLAWIRSAPLCRDRDAKLGAASERLRQADSPGARSHLRSVLTQLDTAHGAGGSVNANAYWLLRANVGFILKQRY